MKKSFITHTLMIAALAGALVTSGCASGPRSRGGDGGKNSGNTSGASPGNGEGYGPQASDANQPPMTYGPEPVQLKPITLVFGPGMARGYAHAGALRALAENKIPIAAIYGAEMGSLMGALYAADSNINTFEWGLIHLKDEAFTAEHGLIGRFFKSGEQSHGDSQKLEEQLKRIFGKRDIAQAKIPLRIELQRKSENSPTLMNKGALVPVLRAAVAGPGFFEPVSINGQSAQGASDSSAVAYLCAEARAESKGPVILIDTATNRNDPSAADLVIRPELDGIGPLDFSKKTEAAFRGKKAVEDHLPEIKRWVGIQDSNRSQEGTSQ
ncbi:MAG: patatin-like phospholipase family protein [Bdellovibrionia bacterium]